MQELAGNGSPPSTAASPASTSQNWPPPALGARPAIAVPGYPVAPARQPIFRFEYRAAGNGRRLTQLAEKRRRHRLGGEFPVLVAISGRIKQLSLVRHIPSTGVTTLAQGEQPDTRRRLDYRSICR